MTAIGQAIDTKHEIRDYKILSPVNNIFQDRSSAEFAMFDVNFKFSVRRNSAKGIDIDI